MGSVPTVKGVFDGHRQSSTTDFPPLRWALSQGTRLYLSQMKAHVADLVAPRPKHYNILTEAGSPIGEVIEDTSDGLTGSVARFVWGSRRQFLMLVTSGGAPVMAIRRKQAWFVRSVEVLDPLGQTLGRVDELSTVFRSKFEIFDSKGQSAARILGSMLDARRFKVFAAGSQAPIACIDQNWTGVAREFLLANTFSVALTAEVDDNLALLLLAATLQIDFCYFEGRPWVSF